MSIRAPHAVMYNASQSNNDQLYKLTTHKLCLCDLSTMSKIHICNTSEAPRKSKAHDLTFYLDSIRKLGREFDHLEAYCTDGDIRPPYPYQWRAVAKMVPGDDDPFEGVGATPLEALRALYKDVKYCEEHRCDEEN